MRLFSRNSLLCVLLVVSGCSDRAPPSKATGGSTVIANDPSNGAYERMQEMHRRLDSLNNMTEAERDMMMREQDRINRENQNRPCGPDNPC